MLLRVDEHGDVWNISYSNHIRLAYYYVIKDIFSVLYKMICIDMFMHFNLHKNTYVSKSISVMLCKRKGLFSKDELYNTGTNIR